MNHIVELCDLRNCVSLHLVCAYLTLNMILVCISFHQIVISYFYHLEYQIHSVGYCKIAKTFEYLIFMHTLKL